MRRPSGSRRRQPHGAGVAARSRIAGAVNRCSGVPALVRPRPLDRAQAVVSCDGRVLFAAIGRAGIVARKREGDNATPRTRLALVAALTRTARAMTLPARNLRRDDGWCDDPTSQRYNRWVRRPCPRSHEVLVRDDSLYDVVVVTDHNQRPRVRGLGSAIFLHLARAKLTPTAGCLAFPAASWHRGTVPRGPFLVGVDPRPLR